MKAQRVKGGRGVVLIVSLLLAASGALRLGAGIGTALANAPAEGADTTPPQVCPETPSAVAEAFRKRDAELTARETAITKRTVALSLSDAAVSKRIEELKTAEAALRKTLAIADGAAEADLTRLTAVYEAMKPADASRMFDKMAPEFAAGFLARMNPSSAAAVLAGMSSDAAYSISVLIAGRNALAPKK